MHMYSTPSSGHFSPIVSLLTFFGIKFLRSSKQSLLLLFLFFPLPNFLFFEFLAAFRSFSVHLFSVPLCIYVFFFCSGVTQCLLFIVCMCLSVFLSLFLFVRLSSSFFFSPLLSFIPGSKYIFFICVH
jgi:hypothetical protein